VSTLEAVHQALQVLEPETPNLALLLSAFDHMIDLHLGAARRAARNPRRRRSAPRPRRHGLPQVLASVAVVHAEMHRSSLDRSSETRELLQLCAYRFSDGRVFSEIVAAETAPRAEVLERMAVRAGEFARASSRERVLGDFARFVGGACHLITWNQHSARDLATLLDAPPGIRLKDVYFRLHRRVPGLPASLGSLCRTLGYAPEALSVPGRAGERLGAMVALTRGLWQYAHRSPGEAVAGEGQAQPTGEQ
jgi:hypothetical protein